MAKRRGPQPGVPRRPTTTPDVLVGLAEILEHLPASFVTTKQRADAVRYLTKLLEVVQHPAYQAKLAEKNRTSKEWRNEVDYYHTVQKPRDSRTTHRRQR